MNIRFAKFIATFAYLGYFPMAAGSIASIIGGLAALALQNHLFLYAAVFLIVTGAGFVASGPVEKAQGEKDPPCIVIDEVSGALIAFFMLPATWPVLFCAFFLFRAFDMFKIYPAYILEQRPGAVGVMMDDIMAGIYTNIVMQIAIRWAGLI